MAGPMSQLVGVSNLRSGLESDTVDLPHVTRGIGVGVAGNIKLTDEGGATGVHTFSAGWHPIRVTRVWATLTTATGIVVGW